MLLWVTSFVDSGYLESEADAKRIYQNLFLISVFCVALIAPMVIRMSDHWHLGWSIGISFLVRSIVFVFGFPNLRTPDSPWTFVMCTLMLAATATQSIAVESFFSKLIPSDIAGSMRGLYNFFGQLGVLLMTVVAGVLYDKWGPASPFLIIGLLDIILAIYTIALCCMGKINSMNEDNKN